MCAYISLITILYSHHIILRAPRFILTTRIEIKLFNYLYNAVVWFKYIAQVYTFSFLVLSSRLDVN